MSNAFRYFNILAISTIFCFILVKSTFNDPNNGRREFISGSQPNILLSSHASFSHSHDADSATPAAGADTIALSLTSPVPAVQPIEEPRADSSVIMPEIPLIPEALTTKRKYREVWATVTAYCPCSRCCGRGSPGVTSTGRSAWVRGIAADPKAIAYGTRIEVPGYGLHVVDDTGGAMRRSWRTKGRLHLDIRMNYHWQARKWGRRLLKVKIYE